VVFVLKADLYSPIHTNFLRKMKVFLLFPASERATIFLMG